MTEGKILRPDNKLIRIEFRTAISTWNNIKKIDLKDLIARENIFYVIQFEKIPEFENKAEYKLFLEGLENKLSNYNTNEKRKFLKELGQLRYRYAAKTIYQLITGKRRLKGDLRGAIAENTSKYVFNSALNDELKLTSNLTIYEDRIKIGKEEQRVGRSKEIDFILTGGNTSHLKAFRENLENKGLGIIINDEYESLILGKQSKFDPKRH